MTRREDADILAAAIREAESRFSPIFRALIERSPDAMLVHRDGRIVYANATAARLLGYAAATELLGRSALSLLHPDDRAGAAEGIRQITGDGTPTPPREMRYLCRDGRVMPCEVQGLPLEWEDGRAVVTIARDLSERKTMQSRLLFAERMASLGTLAGGLAHEINNPLAYLMANLRYLTEELSDVAGLLPEGRMLEIFDALEDAESGADRVRQIVRDLETFSRGDDDRRTPVDVRRVLETAMGLAWSEIRQRARLLRDLGEVPLVSANEARLGQVFLGLLVNAAEAIDTAGDGAGEIRVRTFVQTTIQPGGGAGDGRRVVVEIADNGAGIAPENIPWLFDPFFTTKPVGAGKGLGLCICHGLVSALGGEITVESEPGRGSVFRVLLPPARRVEAAPSLVTASSSRRGQILIVDDEPMILTSLRRLLAPEHEVTPVGSAREALHFVTAGRRFDVILCDLMMPEMTGMDLHAQLAALAPDLAERMIFASGGAFTARARSFIEERPGRYLAKPFDEHVLRSRIHALLT